MSIKPIVGQFAALEDSGQVFMARILGMNGLPITQETITSITYTAWDLNVSRTTAATSATALASTDVISNVLLLTPPWTADEIGRNFTHQIAGSVFPNETPEHVVEYKFIPTTTAHTFYMQFKGSVHEVRMA